MPRLGVVLLTLLCATASLAQSGSYANREQALNGLSAPEAARRAEAVTWIASHGTQADCDQVIKRNPQHFGALAGYGQIYFELERYDKAIEYWRRALEVNPNMVGVEFNIRGAEQLLAEKRRRVI